MERKLMQELIKWKDHKGRKPLILEGARQVGKTWLLKEFDKRHCSIPLLVDMFADDSDVLCANCFI